jgi:hypothetical protein
MPKVRVTKRSVSKADEFRFDGGTRGSKNQTTFSGGPGAKVCRLDWWFSPQMEDHGELTSKTALR